MFFRDPRHKSEGGHLPGIPIIKQRQAQRQRTIAIKHGIFEAAKPSFFEKEHHNHQPGKSCGRLFHNGQAHHHPGECQSAPASPLIPAEEEIDGRRIEKQGCRFRHDGPAVQQADGHDQVNGKSPQSRPAIFQQSAADAIAKHRRTHEKQQADQPGHPIGLPPQYLEQHSRQIGHHLQLQLHIVVPRPVVIELGPQRIHIPLGVILGNGIGVRLAPAIVIFPRRLIQPRQLEQKKCRQQKGQQPTISPDTAGGFLEKSLHGSSPFLGSEPQRPINSFFSLHRPRDLVNKRRFYGTKRKIPRKFPRNLFL